MTQRPLITTRFDGSSTAEDVIAGVDLHGLRAVVTGASSGIGAGARPGCWRPRAPMSPSPSAIPGRRVADRIAASARGSPGLPWRPSTWLTRTARPVSRGTRTARCTCWSTTPAWSRVAERTKKAELQFATNHLGHFALAWALHNALAQGAQDRGTARIVRSAPPPTCAPRLTSMTSTSNAGLTTRRPRTPSRRPRTRCSPSRRPCSGAPRASRRTRSIPEGSRPGCNGTSRSGSANRLTRKPRRLHLQDHRARCGDHPGGGRRSGARANRGALPRRLPRGLHRAQRRGPVRPSPWRQGVGTSTRTTHARLDGVPQDAQPVIVPTNTSLWFRAGGAVVGGRITQREHRRYHRRPPRS